jgi:hypothetical protein
MLASLALASFDAAFVDLATRRDLRARAATDVATWLSTLASSEVA